MNVQVHKDRTVGQVLAAFPAARDLFEEYRIDYCCGGKQNIAEAAAGAGVDFDALRDQIMEAQRKADVSAPKRDWTKASLTELTHHIVDTHHVFMKEKLPQLENLFHDVRKAHGDRHGRLLDDLYRVFSDLRAEIEMHLAKEEQILFPYILQMDQGLVGGFHCGSVEHPIAQMEVEHDNAGDALARFRELTSDYELPEDACAKFCALYEGLQAVEKDLHQHIHLENNILFPRAVEKEHQNTGASAR